ncbi:MAG: PSD1 and planctomycete cytochrome C domain-containing protein [Planctomycetaceae bacterium]|jgi:hypothetical protein|nr:PSD1 and planctomycete cytochrome C domain-containing protein [Planctomycetaceae bacterium]
MKRLVVTTWLTCALLIFPGLIRGAEPALSPREQVEFFSSKVKPLLVKRCFKCHGDTKIKGGLHLNSRSGIMKGGDSGQAINLKRPLKSLLLEAVNYELEGYEMPPSGKLPAEQIAILARWVRMGLPVTPDFSGKIGNQPRSASPMVTPETKRFWSFQPVKRPAVPAVRDRRRVINSIDAFVQSRLDAAGLTPAASVSRVALLRRASYDLTGLPPTPAEVEDFLADQSPRAFERVVDRLLDSPHYGERWARHWLDLVRYAETNSYERDGAKPFVWRYRDYVIRSLNADKPFDQFTREQLAGDELDTVTPETQIATGYYRLGIWQDEPVDREQELFEDLDDHVRTTGEVFLGLTVGCARCHEHKLDPISQRDYYRLLAFFRNIRRYGVRGRNTVESASITSIASEADRKKNQKLVVQHQQELKVIQREIREFLVTVKPLLKGGEVDDFKREKNRVPILKKKVPGKLPRAKFDAYVKLVARRDRLRKYKPPGLAVALVVKENGPTVPQSYVQIRGNAHARGEKVEPGFLEILSPPKPNIRPPAKGAKSSNRRRALAEWITTPSNPLTARVLANRLWQYHFGRGIVRSPNNFGLQGRPPTHPRLLDWLASELVDGGWKLKRMHRLIMLSATYRMSSAPSQAGLKADPTNNLFWRFDMRRLSAEEIRDSVLAVNGALNRGKMFGPSIYTIIPNEIKHGQSQPGSGWGNSPPAERNRRSIYVHVKRSLVVPMFETFDGADLDTSCPVRFTTTQPTQSLALLNGQFSNREAEVFARLVRGQAGKDRAKQVTLALSRATQRRPTEKEVRRGVALIEALEKQDKASPEQALKYFCLLTLNLNEFLYLD